MASPFPSRWWNHETLAVVTGGNRGIGLATVRLLAKNGLRVVLTARKHSAGLEAYEALKKEGLNCVIFHQLDVESPESIAKFAEWLKAEHRGLDILINNAGVSGMSVNKAAMVEFKIEPRQIFTDQDASRKVLTNDFEVGSNCLDINYYGVKRTIAVLLPLFRSSPAGARIINLSSKRGQLKLLPNACLRQQFSNPENLTEELVETTIKTYLDDFKEGRLAERKWPIDFSAYTMSKIALNAYTRMLARDLEARPEGHKIFANVVHPGWVKTDMTTNTGDFTADESAGGVVWLALLAEGRPSGQFFYRKEPYEF